MDNSIKQRHASLVEEIVRHDRAYYVDAQPVISDQDYDRLYRELLDLEAKHPELSISDSPSQRVGGEPLEGFDTVQHALPMMSLDNTYSQDEVREFIDRVQKLLPDESLDWIVEPKADGIAISLRYEDGQFTVGLREVTVFLVMTLLRTFVRFVVYHYDSNLIMRGNCLVYSKLAEK